MALLRPLWLAAAALAAGACTQTVPAASQFAGDAAVDTAADGSGDAAPQDSGDTQGCSADACDDHDPCTVDTCIGGTCSHGKAADGSGCGAFKVCKAGACVKDCGAGFLPWYGDGGGGAIAGCAAEYPVWGTGPSTPAGLKDGGDGSVSDALTGLQWQQASAPTPMTWKDALGYCRDTLVLAGQSDWRLPTRAELDSLVDFGRSKPSIAPALFPNTALDRHWTAVPGYGAPQEAWGVDFSIGFQGVELTHNLRAVRCVRGQVGAPAFTARFAVDAAQGTVLDRATQLTWQRAIDTSGGEDGEGGRTLMQALGYCDKLTLAGGGWRLPEVRELRSLVDSAAEPPALDHTAFPATPGKGYWSHTVDAASATSYWYVHFIDGFSDVEDVSTPLRVRCVR